MEIKELEELIVYHQNAYYNGNAEISDAEFDALWDELKSKDPTNKLITSKVGKDDSDFFPKTKHLMIMGSQEKANSKEEVEKKLGNMHGNRDALIEWKLDGSSIELQYEHGKFKKAVTRGDAEIGDDITPNALKMNGVILDIKEDFTGPIRGEVLLSKENKEKYFKDYKNCRAAANGIMKRKDGEGSQYLDILVYDARYSDKSKSFENEESLMMWLESKGFKTPEWALYENLDADTCMKKLEDIFSNLSKIPYDIDGLVIKQAEIDMDDLNTNICPKTQFALKPARSYATSTVKDIVWDNTNGSFTPVCIIEPTELLGAEIERVNAYNIQFLLDMQIEIGDIISFTRFGEIIPGVARNLSKNTVNPRCKD